MKKILFAAAIVAVFAACTAKAPKVEAIVSNASDTERVKETVELAWSDVTARLAGVTPETVVVTDAEGKQVASQVIYDGQTEPQSLIFQATVAPKANAAYGIVIGQREEYPAQAYGRYVPERKDDYAWENNLVGFRMYGPALEVETITHGVDVWVKRTENLVVNRWYKEGNYHKDNGDGMDCYKVGPTLGGGGAAPFAGGKLWMPHNYASWKTLDNGPIRTAFELTYAPYDVQGDTVSSVKKISLDANTRFTKVVETFGGKFTNMDIAAGIVVHTATAPKIAADEYVSLYEPASDSHEGNEGNIGVAVIMQGGKVVELPDHLLEVKSVTPGQSVTYYHGSGWSKGGVPDAQVWEGIVKAEVAALNAPLQVTLK